MRASVEYSIALSFHSFNESNVSSVASFFKINTAAFKYRVSSFILCCLSSNHHLCMSNVSSSVVCEWVGVKSMTNSSERYLLKEDFIFLIISFDQFFHQLRVKYSCVDQVLNTLNSYQSERNICSTFLMMISMFFEWCIQKFVLLFLLSNILRNMSISHKIDLTDSYNVSCLSLNIVNFLNDVNNRIISTRSFQPTFVNLLSFNFEIILNTNSLTKEYMKHVSSTVSSCVVIWL